MFLDYSENSKGYRVYNLESNKATVTRSMKLNEREVDGIYDSAPTASTAVIHSTEDVNDVVLHEPEQQASADVPMGSVEENHEEDTDMPEAASDDSTRHELSRYRRATGEAFSNNMIFNP